MRHYFFFTILNPGVMLLFDPLNLIFPPSTCDLPERDLDISRESSCKMQLKISREIVFTLQKNQLAINIHRKPTKWNTCAT